MCFQLLGSPPLFYLTTITSLPRPLHSLSAMFRGVGQHCYDTRDAEPVDQLRVTTLTNKLPYCNSL